MNQKNRLLLRVLKLLEEGSIMLEGKTYDEAVELRYAIKKNLGLLK